MTKMMSMVVIGLALVGVAVGQTDKFMDRLLQNRYPLNLESGRLSGAAVPVLQSALSGAQAGFDWRRPWHLPDSPVRGRGL